MGEGEGRVLPLLAVRHVASRQQDIGPGGVGAALAVEAQAGGEVNELVVPSPVEEQVRAAAAGTAARVQHRVSSGGGRGVGGAEAPPARAVAQREAVRLVRRPAGKDHRGKHVCVCVHGLMTKKDGNKMKMMCGRTNKE